MKTLATTSACALLPLEVGSPLLGVAAFEAPDTRCRPFETPSAASKARLVELLHAHFGAVRRFVRRFGVDSDSIDDAAQEVFIVVARRLAEIEVGRERQFLFGIALRVAANARRARGRRREEFSSVALPSAVSSVSEPDALLETKRLRQLLDQVLDRLPEDLRAAFVLFEFEGFSVPEIAELCGIPLGTAASRLRRARESFQAEAARLKEAMRYPGDRP